MRPQAIDSPATWPMEVTPRSGVIVLSGYGLDVRVWRGRLRAADGVGQDRREVLVHRVTGRLKRLVVLGHTGSISLDAIRWLADVGAGYLQVDADGRVLAAFGPQGTNRPGLRRAQARALDTPLGLGIARRLIADKIAAQTESLVALKQITAVPDDAFAHLSSSLSALHVAGSRDGIRAAEAGAAAAYWSALGPVPVVFAKRDEGRVPAHWLTVGGRTSPLTGGPRLAANPANAVLNYLYALLEGGASLAARTVGLDPGLGVLHADQLNRDSLAADIMEPVRPIVDRFVLNLLSDRVFASSDFHETRQGACRLTPTLAGELAHTAGAWAKAVGRVAEDVARLLDDGGRSDRALPTPASGRNRAAARSTGLRKRLGDSDRALAAVARRCSSCGALAIHGRRTCSDECARARRGDGREAFYRAGPDRLAALRAEGHEPLDTGAREQLGRRQRERQRQENEWNAAHPERADPETFRREVLPAIQGVPLRELAKRTGLSVAYCARIRRGEEVPHERWWRALAIDLP